MLPDETFGARLPLTSELDVVPRNFDRHETWARPSGTIEQFKFEQRRAKVRDDAKPDGAPGAPDVGCDRDVEHVGAGVPIETILATRADHEREQLRLALP